VLSGLPSKGSGAYQHLEGAGAHDRSSEGGERELVMQEFRTGRCGR